MEHVDPIPLRTRPRASVIVPCYNYGRFLPDAVAGALDQPGVDIEVIIADNGSTDDSLAVAERLAAADSRIRIHRRPHNIDYLENFNAGLALATGAYVQVLCADDLLAPGAISRATWCSCTAPARHSSPNPAGSRAPTSAAAPTATGATGCCGDTGMATTSSATRRW